MRSFWIALSMYSKLPVPQVEWDKHALSWALCWFPAVGIAAGGGLWLWFQLSALLRLGGPLFAAGALLVPILVSGAIHLDGFCDTCDALSSHQSRERKPELLPLFAAVYTC